MSSLELQENHRAVKCDAESSVRSPVRKHNLNNKWRGALNLLFCK